MVTALLQQVLIKAKKAVALDEQGNYKEALTFYRSVITQLESNDLIQSAITVAEKQKINSLVNNYQFRISLIQQTYPHYLDKVPDWTLDTVSVKSSSNAVDLATSKVDKIAKVLYLMQLIADSIVKGAWLSPQLYVCRDVWSHRQNLSHGELKSQSAETILLWLDKLNGLDLDDTSAMNKELGEFCQVLMGIRSQFAEKMSFISESKSARTMKKSTIMNTLAKQVDKLTVNAAQNITNNSQSNNTNYKEQGEISDDYVRNLYKLLTVSAFMSMWKLHFNSLPPTDSVKAIGQRIDEVVDFFNEVLCRYLLNDIAIQIRDYTTNLKNIFDEY
ncbi:hypothetical protein MIR68_000940 [Amoeboaphelidium protococcarum]|nr:hypothetical protein MIR68_000940 [Amoeboaphelidium protococcarum]